MSKPIVLGAAALLASGAGLATWLWGAPFSRRAEVALPPPPPVPVVVQTVQTSDFPIVRTGIGTVVAFNTVDIRTQVTGTIEKIGFVEGETVHAGSLIAQLDPRPFQAALDQAKANLARDEAHLANANVNLKR